MRPSPLGHIRLQLQTKAQPHTDSAPQGRIPDQLERHHKQAPLHQRKKHPVGDAPRQPGTGKGAGDCERQVGQGLLQAVERVGAQPLVRHNLGGVDDRKGDGRGARVHRLGQFLR